MRFNGITILGALFILLWISHIPYLIEIPLSSTPGIQSLSRESTESSEWIKDQVGVVGKNQKEIKSDLIKSFRVSFIVGLIFNLLGIVAGFLVLKKSKVGFYLALGLSIYVLGRRCASLILSENIIQRMYAKYTILFPEMPLRIIHNDIITEIILLVTIFYLLRPSVYKQFNIGSSKSTLEANTHS